MKWVNYREVNTPLNFIPHFAIIIIMLFFDGIFNYYNLGILAIFLWFIILSFYLISINNYFRKVSIREDGLVIVPRGILGPLTKKEYYRITANNLSHYSNINISFGFYIDNIKSLSVEKNRLNQNLKKIFIPHRENQINGNSDYVCVKLKKSIPVSKFGFTLGARDPNEVDTLRFTVHNPEKFIADVKKRMKRSS